MRRNSRSDSNGKNNGDTQINNKHDDIEDVKPIKKSKIKAIKNFLVDYTANSNLHGLKYVGEKERTIVEKIFWTVAFILSVLLCGYLIRKVWIKWDTSPVIVSFAETTTPVWQIPYPAVTICFETKAMQTKFNFTANFHSYNKTGTIMNMTEEARNMYEDLTLICDNYLYGRFGREFSNGTETVKNIKSVSPNITEQFFECKWQDVAKETCEHLFSPIVTEEGLCYTFNMLTADELYRVENLHKDYPYLELERPKNRPQLWSLDSGYPDNAPLDTYPHRGTGYGVKTGLSFMMKTKAIDLDYLCRGPVQGFKILFHNPAELPRLSQSYFRSPLSQEVVVAVKPKVMTTSEGLRPYLPERRQCYFPSERYLKYFKIYTQSNCELECLSNFTYKICDCVHFGLPRSPDIKVCNTAKIPCMQDSQMNLVVADVEAVRGVSNKNQSKIIQEANEIARKCRCLPACVSIGYEAETSQANFNWKAIKQATGSTNPDEGNDMLYSRVMVFFKEPQFITSRRSELYGQTDFLANCGGLLGLFMGFSILSVAEILYFLTLRLCCVIRRQRNTKKAQISNDDKKI